MVSITVSPRGKSRVGRLSQVDEYLIVVYIGAAVVADLEGRGVDKEIRWRYLRRNDIESARGTVKGGPSQFYPIYVDATTQRIVKIGQPLAPEEPLESAPRIQDQFPVFPIREDGVHMNWGLTGPSLQRALDDGYVSVTRGSHPGQPFTFAYLTSQNIKKVAQGTLRLAGTRPDGSKIVLVPGGKEARPTTAWRESRYDAGAYGTTLLGNLIPGRKFPYPKSLYAVEDSLRLFLQEKPKALVLDFFAGSGTTAHAVARLNRQDGGCRRSVSVTNNEVSEEEAKLLRRQGYSPGDPEWEDLGIFAHIAVPRLTAAIGGKRPDGTALEGDYTFGDEFPMAEGFDENFEFFELQYLDPDDIALGEQFEAIHPLLWLAAGSIGKREEVPMPREFFVAQASPYGVLFKPSRLTKFLKQLVGRTDVTHVWIVTDSEEAYAESCEALPRHITFTSRLYHDYLRTFRVNARRF